MTKHEHHQLLFWISYKVFDSSIRDRFNIGDWVNCIDDSVACMHVLVCLIVRM